MSLNTSAVLNRRAVVSASAAALLLPMLQACGAKSDESEKQSGASAKGAGQASVLAVPAGVTPFQELENRRAELGGFVVGSLMAKTRAIVFYDPLCPHCARLWKAFEPIRNRTSVYWVPLAFMGAASAYLGALELQTATPSEQMEAIETAIHQNNQDPLEVLKANGVTADSDGKVKYPPQMQGALDKIAANTKYASGHEIDGVPYVLYANDTSTALRSFGGERQTQQLIELFGQS